MVVMVVVPKSLVEFSMGLSIVCTFKDVAILVTDEFEFFFKLSISFLTVV